MTLEVVTHFLMGGAPPTEADRRPFSTAPLSAGPSSKPTRPRLTLSAPPTPAPPAAPKPATPVTPVTGQEVRLRMASKPVGETDGVGPPPPPNSPPRPPAGPPTPPRWKRKRSSLIRTCLWKEKRAEMFSFSMLSIASSFAED